MTEDNQAYRITIKGFLGLKTGNNDLWEELIKLVKKQAKENGYNSGTPAIVLEDGGICITVEPI